MTLGALLPPRALAARSPVTRPPDHVVRITPYPPSPRYSAEEPFSVLRDFRSRDFIRRPRRRGTKYRHQGVANFHDRPIDRIRPARAPILQIELRIGTVADHPCDDLS